MALGCLSGYPFFFFLCRITSSVTVRLQVQSLQGHSVSCGSLKLIRIMLSVTFLELAATPIVSNTFSNHSFLSYRKEDLIHRFFFLLQKRGATIYAEFLGGSFTCDAYHMTEPHPDGNMRYLWKSHSYASHILLLSCGTKKFLATCFC